MSPLMIQTAEGRTDFFSGEEVRGFVGWELEKPAEAIELRLFWYTRGKGTVDASVAKTVRFDRPAQSGQSEFQMKLPDSPYSFSGKLVSLIWAFELVVEPSGETERLDISITPTGSEIDLHKPAEAPAQ